MFLTHAHNLTLTILLFLLSQGQPLAPSMWGWNASSKHNIDTTDFVLEDGVPHERTANGSTVYSACGNNGQDFPASQTNAHPEQQATAFACPHMLMFSTDMTLAAQHDQLDNDFLYAVCGGMSDGECGRCYQVQPYDAEVAWNDTLQHRQLIVQVINSGFDVEPGHFDIFMGGGGFGWFTACNKDCRNNYCQGGACSKGMYAGDFSAWNPGPEPQKCYAGGVSLRQQIKGPWPGPGPGSGGDNETKVPPVPRLKSVAEITAACAKLTGMPPGNAYKDKVLVQSCVDANLHLYHQNFFSTNSVAVHCPDGLVRLTGLRRADEDDLPFPHPNNQLTTHCRGTGHSFCMTTMQDCCLPSCAWMNKGTPDKVWKQVDACKEDGTLYNYVTENH